MLRFMYIIQGLLENAEAKHEERMMRYLLIPLWGAQ